MLIIPRQPHNIGIETIEGDQLNTEQLDRVTSQLGYFMVWVQDYYEHALGLTRTDPDPRPGTLANYHWRQPRIKKTGSLSRGKEREIILARRLTSDSTVENPVVDESTSAIRGLLVVSSPETGVLEIDEIDSKDKGLGRILLGQAVNRADPTGMIILDVAESNPARDSFYRPHGFLETGTTFRHGDFDVTHVQLAVQTAIVARHLEYGPYERPV